MNPDRNNRGKPRMLQLTARYANSWNTAWLGQPAVREEEIVER